VVTPAQPFITSKHNNLFWRKKRTPPNCATQAPIKDRYKSDPKSAVITLKAKGSIDNEGIACKVETGRAYCVVYQTIGNGPKVAVTMQRA
jgi:hypothetical protein